MLAKATGTNRIGRRDWGRETPKIPSSKIIEYKSAQAIARKNISEINETWEETVEP